MESDLKNNLVQDKAKCQREIEDKKSQTIDAGAL